jgi:hypothetical protein
MKREPEVLEPEVLEPEVLEPGGRKHQLAELMTSEDIVAAYADAIRLRAHELSGALDSAISSWMRDARKVLAKRGHLDLIRHCLPVYYDPTRKQAVFGPGGGLVSREAIERAIQPPTRPVRAIAAS